MMQPQTREELLSFEERFDLLRETRRRQRARHKTATRATMDKEEAAISSIISIHSDSSNNNRQATSHMVQSTGATSFSALQAASRSSHKRHKQSDLSRPKPSSSHTRKRILLTAATCLIMMLLTGPTSAESIGASKQVDPRSDAPQSQLGSSSAKQASSQTTSSGDNNNNIEPTQLAASKPTSSNNEPIAMAVSAAPTSGAAVQSSPTSGGSATAAAAAAVNTNKQPNVIVIKYANVSTASADSSDYSSSGEQLKILQLINEPLSVSLIEQKFSQSIQLFDVSQNHLSTLSKDLFCPLSNDVRHLNTSHNLLENFDCLGLISQAGQLCLSELRVLDMSYNLIRHLPATGVATLHNLEYLDLSHNQIESLDELALSSLFKLISLDLSHNRLKQLPQRLFHKSAAMRYLSLQANHLQINLTQQLLTGLISLEELNLSYNNITQISELTFIDKINLTKVDLTFNQLSSLRQESLRIAHNNNNDNSVPAMRQQAAPVVVRQRMHHNGQFAGITTVNSAASSMMQRSLQAEFYLFGNPFTCDCHLDWMRRSQSQTPPPPPQRSQLRRAVQASNRWPLTFPPNQPSLPATAPADSAYQNDQPTVMQQQHQHNPDNNQDSGNHYGRIADFEYLKCSPLYRGSAQRSAQQQHRQRNRAPATPSGAAYGDPSNIHTSHLHHSLHLHSPAAAAAAANHQHLLVDIATADSSNFLCPYKSHCFALCHCCEFDACDCEMICPNKCQCYYDSSWHTNVIDCSSSNHTHVPERIPMDSTELRLDGNNITSLRPSNLIARKSLKSLYLNSTNLHHIANRTFNGLIELQVLYLNENQLRQLNGHEFEPLGQLRQLYLQSNRLDSIANNTFIYLRSLELLDLSNNRLVSSIGSFDLFWSVARHNIRLRQLSLAHNWWSCQCQSMLSLRQLLTQKFLLAGGVAIADRNQLRCYYNATTVGPLLLDSTSGSTSRSMQAQQPQLTWPLAPSSFANNSPKLVEINECSDEADLRMSNFELNELSPPILARDYPPPPPPPQLDQLPAGSDGSYGSLETDNRQQQPPYADQPYAPPDEMQPQLNQHLHSQLPFQQQQQQHQAPMQPAPTNYIHKQVSGQQQSIGVSSFLVASLSGALVLLVAVVAFLLLIRQQQLQQRADSTRRSKADHFRRSGKASLGSSSAASSVSTHSCTGSQLKRPTTLASGANQLFASAAGTLHHHHHQHHSSGGTGAPPAPPHHLSSHQHSNSSQSNIYAALVSPNAPNSTVVATSAAPPNNLYASADSTGSQRSSAQQQQQQQQVQWTTHHASHPHPHHHHQYNHTSQLHQQPIYGAPSSVYSPAYNAHKSLAGSVYDYELPPTSVGLQHGAPPPPPPRGRATLIGPARSFVSRLVSKSLALGSQALKSVAQGSSSLRSGNLASGQHHHHQHHQQQHHHSCILAHSHHSCASSGHLTSGLNCNADQVAASDSTTTTTAYAASLASDKIYDIFLSYDKRDERFVLEHLSAELEYGQPQYRVADRYRDLPLPSSAYMAEAISSVIGCSHRTVLFLTENYLSNEWCRYELSSALNEAAIEKSHKLIAIVLEPKCLLNLDAEMRALLTNGQSSNIQPIYAGSSSLASHHNNNQQLIQVSNESGANESSSSSSQQSLGSKQQRQLCNLVAMLSSDTIGSPVQQIQTKSLAQAAGSNNATPIASSKYISFLNYNERKFWLKFKQLLPVARASAIQTLTLTTKN